MNKIIIPSPCVEEVESYLEKWNNLEGYPIQEKALDKLFLETYPRNTNLLDILIKVASLNDFYSTNIYKSVFVAEHIADLNIDEDLKIANPLLVNNIASIDIKGKHKYFYSFATKYCSRHNPSEYPIYDSYVEKVLLHFRDTSSFYKFSKKDLKDYPSYKNIVINFRSFYNLENYTFKELDKYLWQLGKSYFPKYNKKK